LRGRGSGKDCSKDRKLSSKDLVSPTCEGVGARAAGELRGRRRESAREREREGESFLRRVRKPYAE